MDRRRRTADPAVAVAVVLATGFGWATWFSRSLYDPAAFDHQYGSGVYRYRVLGRELVRGVERLVGNPLGEHLAPRVAGSNPGGMFTALVLVNGAALLATLGLVHLVLARTEVPEPGRTLAFVTVAAVIGLTGYVVTPYDQLATLLVLAALVSASARPPWDLAALALAAAATATRESAVLVPAALLAVSWPAWRTGRPDRSARLALAAAAVVGGGYLALRWALGTDGGGAFGAQVTLAGNLGRPLGWIGAALAVSALWWWWRVLELAGLGPSPLASPGPVRRLWAFALPYLVGVAVLGYWFEARLLVPVLVGELWVRSRAARMGP